MATSIGASHEDSVPAEQTRHALGHHEHVAKLRNLEGREYSKQRRQRNAGNGDYFIVHYFLLSDLQIEARAKNHRSAAGKRQAFPQGCLWAALARRSFALDCFFGI
jgi:hypothetical protein